MWGTQIVCETHNKVTPTAPPSCLSQVHACRHTVNASLPPHSRSHAAPHASVLARHFVRQVWSHVVSSARRASVECTTSRTARQAPQFAKCFPSHCSVPGHGRRGGVAGGGSVWVEGVWVRVECVCVHTTHAHFSPAALPAAQPARTHAAIALPASIAGSLASQPGQPVGVV